MLNVDQEGLGHRLNVHTVISSVEKFTLVQTIILVNVFLVWMMDVVIVFANTMGLIKEAFAKLLDGNNHHHQIQGIIFAIAIVRCLYIL